MLAEPGEELRFEDDLIECDVGADELDGDFGVLPHVAATPDLAEVAVPGAKCRFADVAAFAVDEGSFQFHDIRMNTVGGRQLLRNTLTVANGRVLEPLPPDPPAPWISDEFVWPPDAFHGGIVMQQRAGPRAS